MSLSSNPPVLPFWEELSYAGLAMRQVPMAIVDYAPYVLGMGLINWAGDWLESVRPLSDYPMTDDFFRHTTQGVVDVAKLSYWGYTYTNGGGGGGYKPAMSYPSSTGWGTHSYGMHGMANPGVNRVAGQY
jgi:hypothetical protein